MFYDHTIKTDSNNQFYNILLEANNLKTQKLSQREEKTPVCNKCDKVFSKASNLKTHMRSHAGEKPLGCKKCDKTFLHQVPSNHTSSPIQGKSHVTATSVTRLFLKQVI